MQNGKERERPERPEERLLRQMFEEKERKGKAIPGDSSLQGRLKRFLDTFAPGRSVRDLAASLEIDFSYLAKVLRGEFSLTEAQKETIARYFFLPVQDFKRYLEGKTDLSRLEGLSESWKFKLIDFSQPHKACPAWKAVLRYVDDDSWLREHQTRFVENVCVFLAYTDLHHSDKEYLAYLKESLGTSPEKLRAWLSSLSPSYQRAVFHAFLFTMDPISYAVEGGLLHADSAFRFKEPDRHLRYPEFAFRLIQSHSEGDAV